MDARARNTVHGMRKKVLTMAEYVTKEQVIDWYRPYGHTDEHIPFETLVSDLKGMKAADVAPVRHGRWEECDYVEPCIHGFGTIRHANAGLKCTNCVNVFKKELLWKDNYCPNCGARMDGDGNG